MKKIDEPFTESADKRNHAFACDDTKQKEWGTINPLIERSLVYPK